jgi:hypothetical protein
MIWLLLPHIRRIAQDAAKGVKFESTGNQGWINMLWKGDGKEDLEDDG